MDAARVFLLKARADKVVRLYKIRVAHAFLCDTLQAFNVVPEVSAHRNSDSVLAHLSVFCTSTGQPC